MLMSRYVTVGQDGAILNALDVADCAHGPHEIRGAIRNDLVRALADALPPGTICYGAPMSSLEFSREGKVPSQGPAPLHIIGCHILMTRLCTPNCQEMLLTSTVMPDQQCGWYCRC